MIDETRAPGCAEWARKNARVLRDAPKMREILEQVAKIEETGLDLKARATIGVGALERLEKMMPDDPLRELMTPVDMRQRLQAIRAEVGEALEAIREIR